MIRHLAEDDPNLPYLVEARDFLDDICRMEKEEEIEKAAAMFGLSQAIENFPVSFLHFSHRIGYL